MLIEAAPQAGGRCRSYFDSQLSQIIDNGNHLVLSGNRATMEYLRRIGSEGGLTGPETAAISFVDIRNGMRWDVAPNDGPLPFWILSKQRRVPDTRAKGYLELAKLVAVRRDRPLDQVLSCGGALWERLLHPFFLAALNTEPETASALLAGALVRETFARGGSAYMPRIAHPTLASVFVDPALALLRSRGAMINLGQRVRQIIFDGRLAIALQAADSTIPISAADDIVLAVPPWSAAELVPELSAPQEFRAIVNTHYKIAPPAGSPAMLGVIGGVAQWIFSFADRISVTISGADAVVNEDREILAGRIWDDVAAALSMSGPLPPWQIVKERRATFAATPDQATRRPPAQTRWSNLVLAGDWTATGLPATIEGAIRSGRTAAQLIMERQS